MSHEIYRSATCLITKENDAYILWRYTWDNLTGTTTKPVKDHKYASLHEALEWASYYALMYQARRAASPSALQALTVLMYDFLSCRPQMLDAGAVEILPKCAPGEYTTDEHALIETTDLNVRFHPAGQGQVQLVLDKDDEDLFDAVLPLGESAALATALGLIYRHW